MTTIWSLVTSGSLGFVGGLIGGTLKWFVPSRKEWVEGRKAKREARTDARVLEAVRALSEGNSFIYGTKDVAEKIGMTIDETADSLARLKIRGRVESYDNGSSDQLGPGWRSKTR